MRLQLIHCPVAAPDPRDGRWGLVIRDKVGGQMYRSPEVFGHPQDAVAAGTRIAATLSRQVTKG